MLAVVIAGVCATAGSSVGSYLHHGAVFRLLHAPRDWAIAGHPAPPYGNAQAWLLKASDSCCVGDRLLFSDDTYQPVPGTTLGFELDVDRTLKRAELASPEATWFGKLRRAFFPSPKSVEVEPALSLDEAVARRFLEQLAPTLDRAPVDAKLDIRARKRTLDVPGRSLDVDASLDVLRASKADGVVELAFREVPARVRTEDLLSVDVSRVLASFETDFKKKAGRRALNIRRAAKLLDRQVLEPGEVLSFNRVVGDRTEANGFTWAPVIVNDEMEPGLGGGVCQVASTLHAAAVLGGLEIKERRSHSRPSGYAPLGLDAAVIYGEVDLKLQNPYPVPLLIHAYFPSEFVLRVELLGADADARIEHEYAVLQKHDFYRRVVEDASLDIGQVERTQKGGYGYDVVSIVKTTGKGDSPSERRYASKYYPVPEVYTVGPGTSLDELPQLPEGATHAELGRPGEETLEQSSEVPSN